MSPTIIEPDPQSTPKPTATLPKAALFKATSPKATLPKGAWDSHVHLVDPDTFPISESAPYYPPRANLDDLIAYETSLGFENYVVVGMHVYHNDPVILLDAVEKLGKRRVKAVILYDPYKVTNDLLLKFHNAGVIGMRFNILNLPKESLNKNALEELLHAYTTVVKVYNWVLQLYLSLDQLPLIADIIPELGVDIVIDHVACPPASKLPVKDQPGHDEMISLLKNGHIWVKMSCLHRLTDVLGVEDYAREIVQAAPDKVVFATDWPHTGGRFNGRSPDNKLPIREFLNIDDQKEIDFVLSLGDQQLAQKIFVDNPRKLWRAE